MIDLFQFVGGIFKPAADLIDNVHTSDEERLELQKELTAIRAGVQGRLLEMESEILKYQTKLVEMQKEVLIAEAQGQSWIQRNWRPVLMLVIVAVLANNYILFPYINVFTEHVQMLPLPDSLFTLLSIGVGGYVVGRSGEKIAQSLRKPKQLSS